MQNRADIVYGSDEEYNKKYYPEKLVKKGEENIQKENYESALYKNIKEQDAEIKQTKPEKEVNNVLLETDKELTHFYKPVEGRITNGFGYRKPPTKGASENHSGIDIAVPIGTPVKSIYDGKVIAAREGMRGYGIGVFIDHGYVNGQHVVSEYGHLSSYSVKIGDKVTKGQVFAKSGNTGISTGPHLHLTIKENGKPVDPQKYLDNF